MRIRTGLWSRRTVGAALASGLMLGFHERRRRRDPVAIVVDDRREQEPTGGVTLFFHPEVPEATLVLLR
jgi:hypothetical protein